MSHHVTSSKCTRRIFIHPPFPPLTHTENAQPFPRTCLSFHCRNLTRDWDDVWVITGPAFLPKKEGNKWVVRYEVLGDPEPNVSVPTHFWKVILAQKGNNGVMASFLLPNERIDDATPLSQFMVPLNKIEKATGLIFFENLRGKLQPGAPLQLPLLCNGGGCNLPPPMPKNNSHN